MENIAVPWEVAEPDGATHSLLDALRN